MWAKVPEVIFHLSTLSILCGEVITAQTLRTTHKGKSAIFSQQPELQPQRHEATKIRIADKITVPKILRET